MTGEPYKMTQKDLAGLGWYPETVKGTPITNQPYRAIYGVLKELSWERDVGDMKLYLPGYGPLPARLIQDIENVRGKLSYLLSVDFIDSDSALFSMIAMAMGQGSLHTVTGRIITRGQKLLNFTTGTGAISAGDQITGFTSGASAIVTEVLVTANPGWGGTTTGVLLLDEVSIETPFQTGENIQVSAVTKVVANGADTEIFSELDSFTIWAQQKKLSNPHHVLRGVHIQKLTLTCPEKGIIEMDIDFKAFRYTNGSVGGTATLPTHALDDKMPSFKYWSAQSTQTIRRAGSDARLKRWSFTIDNGDLAPIMADGQNYPDDYVPSDHPSMPGDLLFFLQSDELYTIWQSDPDTLKSIAFDGQTVNFTAGAKLINTTRGSTALIVSVTDAGATGTLYVTDVQGPFLDGDTLTDDAGAGADGACNGDMTDTTSIDFELILTKNSGAEYLSIKCRNVMRRGTWKWSQTPQQGESWMVEYPFEIFLSGNLQIQLVSP